MSDKKSDTSSNEAFVLTSQIMGGPIENRGYDYLRLAQDHDVVLPDGTELRLPTGSLLYRRDPHNKDGYIQNKGAANRAKSMPPGDGGSA